jgi:predicted Zn-dependent protease
MSQDRIALFEAMAADQPENEMVWYGLANEYIKAENWPKAAETLERVISIKPDYTAAYQLLGTAHERAGKPNEAREAWTKGIEVADRTGAWKARSHMEGLMQQIKPDTGFCE